MNTRDLAARRQRIATSTAGRQATSMLGVLCRSCHRAVAPDRAATIAANLEKLGAKPETIAMYTPICGRCARSLCDLAASMSEPA